jgi:dephospho-CoA kinase
MPYMIGITGGIGGGKTTVARFLAEAGAHVIDTDTIARELTVPGSEAMDEILTAFGDSVFLHDGNLDRKAMAEIVFNDSGKLALLNSILHPRIRQRWQDDACNSTEPFVFVVVPVLYENNLADYFDEIWVITASDEERIKRVMSRDGVDRESVISRLRSQMPEQRKIQLADLVIDTGHGFDAARADTDNALAGLKRRLGLDEK